MSRRSGTISDRTLVIIIAIVAFVCMYLGFEVFNPYDRKSTPVKFIQDKQEVNK